MRASCRCLEALLAGHSHRELLLREEGRSRAGMGRLQAEVEVGMVRCTPQEDTESLGAGMHAQLQTVLESWLVPTL